MYFIYFKRLLRKLEPEGTALMEFKPTPYCFEHNSKTNDHKLFKLGIKMILGYPVSDVVWGSKVKGQCRTVNKCIFTLLSAA